MLLLWRRGLRNGAIRRLHYLKRGLFSAALEYSRMTGKIINSKLVEIIEGVADRIRNSIGKKIFNHGLDRARDLVTNAKVMRTFPVIRRWVNEGPYVFWLGTELLTNRRSWIWS
jgi:hypothetical protein